MKWSTNGFEVLPNTLSYDHTIMLVSELAEIMEKDDYRTIKNKGNVAVKITSEHDHEIVCLDFYSLPIFNSVAMMLIEKIESIVKTRVTFTYSYARFYTRGNSLLKHTDRRSCEYSITLNLFSTHDWDIFLNDTPVNLKQGDALLYAGSDLSHYRNVFEGDLCAQVFFHYVNPDGPHRDFCPGIGFNDGMFPSSFNIDDILELIDKTKNTVKLKDSLGVLL